jgi:hypothetical protein
MVDLAEMSVDSFLSAWSASAPPGDRSSYYAVAAHKRCLSMSLRIHPWEYAASDTVPDTQGLYFRC